jgi:hypothetical protein
MKTLFLLFQLPVLFFTFLFSVNHKIKPEIKSPCTLQFQIKNQTNNTVTITISDADESSGPVTINSGGSTAIYLTGNTSTGDLVDLCFSMSTPHPASRFKMWDYSGAVVECINMGANVGIPFCTLNDINVPCPSTANGFYFIEFKGVSCPN